MPSDAMQLFSRSLECSSRRPAGLIGTSGPIERMVSPRHPPQHIVRPTDNERRKAKPPKDLAWNTTRKRAKNAPNAGSGATRQTVSCASPSLCLVA